MAFLLLYVDDIVLITSSPNLHHELMALLAKEFAMKDLNWTLKLFSWHLGIPSKRFTFSVTTKICKRNPRKGGN